MDTKVGVLKQVLIKKQLKGFVSLIDQLITFEKETVSQSKNLLFQEGSWLMIDQTVV